MDCSVTVESSRGGATTDVRCHRRLTWPLLELLVKEIIQYVNFLVSLFTHAIFLTFVHEQYFLLSLHQLRDTHMSYIQFLETMCKAAMNIHVQGLIFFV